MSGLKRMEVLKEEVGDQRVLMAAAAMRAYQKGKTTIKNEDKGCGRNTICRQKYRNKGCF